MAPTTAAAPKSSLFRPWLLAAPVAMGMEGEVYVVVRFKPEVVKVAPSAGQTNTFVNAVETYQKPGP